MFPVKAKSKVCLSPSTQAWWQNRVSIFPFHSLFCSWSLAWNDKPGCSKTPRQVDFSEFKDSPGLPSENLFQNTTRKTKPEKPTQGWKERRFVSFLIFSSPAKLLLSYYISSIITVCSHNLCLVSLQHLIFFCLLCIKCANDTTEEKLGRMVA